MKNIPACSLKLYCSLQRSPFDQPAMKKNHNSETTCRRFIVLSAVPLIKSEHFLVVREASFNHLCTGNPLANSEDPDEMPHHAAFHQGLHCLISQNQPSEKIIFFKKDYNL